MAYVLLTLAGLAALAGPVVFSVAESALHEIEVFILFLIGAVLLSGSAIAVAVKANAPTAARSQGLPGGEEPPRYGRKCPVCAEMIRPEAVKCRYCGSTVEPADSAPDVGQHADRRSKPRFHLRGTPAANRGLRLAPLQVLWYFQTGQTLDADEWTEAAEALRIPVQEAAEIVAASSDRAWTGPEGNRAPSDELLALRRALLEAVGLVVAVPA
jgi:hypothetical protein